MRRRLQPGTEVVPSAKANPDVRAWLPKGGKVVDDTGSVTKVREPGGVIVWCEREHLKLRHQRRRHA